MTKQEIRKIIREELYNLIQEYLDVREEERLVYDLVWGRKNEIR